MDMKFSIDTSAHRARVKQIPIQRRMKLRLILEQHGIEAVNKITGFTSQTSPPVRAGEGPRRQHPGGWADVTTNLRRAISSEVQVDPRGVELHIGVLAGRQVLGVSVNNVIEYAVYLDNMAGISVLGGIPKKAFESLVKNLRMLYD